MNTQTIKRDQDENGASWVDDGKHFANKKLRGKNFSKRNLANADFRGAELIEAIFDDCDLTCAKFNGANCWGASFKRAKCYKANFTQTITTHADFDAADMRAVTLTLNCDTFENVKLSKKWLGGLLFLIAIADIPVETQKQIAAIIGEEEFKRWQTIRMGI